MHTQKWVATMVLMISLTSGVPMRLSVSNTALTTHNYCWRTRVHLNGSNPPTVTCLIQDPPTSRGQTINPNISQSNCTIYDLQLFQDSQYGGAEICFAGVGHLNLEDYNISFFENWNDEVSSYKSGVNTGIFTWDDDAHGAVYPYQDHLLCPWIGSFWNDEISYVAIDTVNGTHGQEFC